MIEFDENRSPNREIPNPKSVTFLHTCILKQVDSTIVLLKTQNDIWILQTHTQLSSGAIGRL